MKTTYSFSTLRFIYDPLTLEFVNVGVVIYSPDTKQLHAKCTQHYGRISKLFESFDGMRLRQTLRFIQDQINDMAEEISSSLAFRPTLAMAELLSAVLPSDDSSLQFMKAGVGITEDFQKTADALFTRYVDRYTSHSELTTRVDEDVWRKFRSSFDRKSVTPQLGPKRIIGKDYEYEFQRSWKNGKWHLYEPISLDLLDASSILEKANRWVGRATSLEDSKEPFKLFLLLGAPEDEKLRAAYKKAENLLHRMPVAHEFIEETNAEDFAQHVAEEMKSHMVTR